MEATVPITCLACGHVDNVPRTAAIEDEAFFAEGIFFCNECNARMVYGELAPRIVVEPYTDGRGHVFVRQRIQDPITKADTSVTDLDPQHAVMMAKALLALVVP